MGNEAPLVIKISHRFKMQRKAYSWAEHRRCTICDNVTVRKPRHDMLRSFGDCSAEVTSVC